MVDKNVVTPLYDQVANELRKEISDNRYGDNGCIGTHAELVERFGVSIRTVRKAVQMLEEEGLVDIRQGKGTFVRKAMLVDHLQDLTGISNLLRHMPSEREIDVRQFQCIATPSWLEKDVRRELGETCTFIRRIVKYHGVPAACADMYLPARMAELFTREEVETNTVYQIYQHKLGIRLGRGKQLIRARGASGEMAKSLEIRPNAPVLEIARRAYDADGGLIEYMILTYEASMYCFEVELELSKEE